MIKKSTSFKRIYYTNIIEFKKLNKLSFRVCNHKNWEHNAYRFKHLSEVKQMYIEIFRCGIVLIYRRMGIKLSEIDSRYTLYKWL